MDTIAVQYLYDPSKAEELAAARPAHREFLGKLFEQGTLLASGPLGEHMALIILDVTSTEDALGLLDDDPLMAAGVIQDRSAQLWNVIYHTWDWSFAPSLIYAMAPSARHVRRYAPAPESP